MTIGVLPIAGRLLTNSFNLHCYCSFSSYYVLSVGDIHVFLPPVVTGNYISYKNQKFQFYHTISLVSLAGHSCIMYIVGPPNRLVLFRLG